MSQAPANIETQSAAGTRSRNCFLPCPVDCVLLGCRGQGRHRRNATGHPARVCALLVVPLCCGLAGRVQRGEEVRKER
ncbi:hypothetical protein NDU88_008825 [Pleurodeles waltl]|uniref:Uncharacterized protein n=1 Tax=Pleurodeles waltl TaxID=8319 RepID=A0AAV7PVH4_PLEWA|nr:hypothetical protein NDU88_008825 [Pleurodeles waltl]